jgi:hypothetical protein
LGCELESADDHTLEWILSLTALRNQVGMGSHFNSSSHPSVISATQTCSSPCRELGIFEKIGAIGMAHGRMKVADAWRVKMMEDSTF